MQLPRRVNISWAEGRQLCTKHVPQQRRASRRHPSLDVFAETLKLSVLKECWFYYLVQTQLFCPVNFKLKEANVMEYTLCI